LTQLREKKRFFMKNDWTVRITLTILIGSLPVAIVAGGGAPVKKMVASSSKRRVKTKSISKEAYEDRIAQLEARLKMLTAELDVLRKTLAGTLENDDKREKALLRIQCSVAASLANGKKRAMSEESVKLLESMSKLVKAGNALVSMSTEFCDFVDNALSKKRLTDLDKARLRFSLEKLKAASELFHSLASPAVDAGFSKSCRVLAVNDKLQLVVLNVGSANGVRNGLNLRRAGKKGKKVLLRVVDVRPYVSGAVVVEGDIGGLAPGMEFTPGG
jgi:hypothetical protein